MIASQAQREAMLAEQRSRYWERQIIAEASSHRSPAEATTDPPERLRRPRRRGAGCDRPESHGNYNALFGEATQQQVRLTDMTLEQVQQVQQQLVAERGGSPVGRYQILDDTLSGLIDRLGLSGQERFTPALQNRMGRVLAEDAGLSDWQSGRLSDETFASQLATIWAGLPKDASNRSHYEGQAGNRALVGWPSVLQELSAARRHRD